MDIEEATKRLEEILKEKHKAVNYEYNSPTGKGFVEDRLDKIKENSNGGWDRQEAINVIAHEESLLSA